jgi:hypothetical protein
LSKRKSAQEQIVDQTKDRGVHPDPEREGEHGEEGERGRFQKLSESEAEIDHWIFYFRLDSSFPNSVWE